MSKLHLTLSLVCFLLCGCSLSGCSPTYVIRAAYEESKILINREDIPDVIADPATSLDEQAKLLKVVAAREFAKNLGLNPQDSFTTYSRVDRDILAWVVVGSKPDAFALHTWWFPIVGSVPYKGFF